MISCCLLKDKSFHDRLPKSREHVSWTTQNELSMTKRIFASVKFNRCFLLKLSVLKTLKIFLNTLVDDSLMSESQISR